jgi:hypothetical protein
MSLTRAVIPTVGEIMEFSRPADNPRGGWPNGRVLRARQDRLPQDMDNAEPTDRERRRHERFTCDGYAEVVVFRPELLFRGEVKDISLTGCYIATRARLKLQRYAEIELRFSANGQQLTSLARVMDIRSGQGVGVEFLPGDPRMSKRFRDLIEQLGSPSR